MLVCRMGSSLDRDQVSVGKPGQDFLRIFNRCCEIQCAVNEEYRSLESFELTKRIADCRRRSDGLRRCIKQIDVPQPAAGFFILQFFQALIANSQAVVNQCQQQVIVFQFRAIIDDFRCQILIIFPMCF